MNPVCRHLPPSKPLPHNPNLSSLDSIDDPYLENRRSKCPLYDELSIPIIDASLVVSVLACIMMAAGNPNNVRCPATYVYSSTSGLVGKWLYDHYLKIMNNCVR